MDAQTKAFQALKPICVTLGEAAKALGEGTLKAVGVAIPLENLKRTLSLVSEKPGALHPKLAEYVFFPISQVLRLSQKASIQCLELCLQCIAILIDQGWRQHLPAQTAAQLVILCTLLAETKPQGLPFAESTEELQTSALSCLYHISTVVGDKDETKQLLTSEAQFPQLGKTISVLLDAVESTGRSDSQAAAANALEALLTHVTDREIHASFLPGIMSKLTKILTPSTRGRTSPKVLKQCLNIVIILLRSTLGEDDVFEAQQEKQSPKVNRPAATIVDQIWQQNAAKQLKPALANIMRLRSHGNHEVKLMLGRLCLTILRSCRKTLSECAVIALDTLGILSAGDRESSLSIEFEMLLQADTSVASSLQKLLYEWLRSLPTIMHGANEDAKAQKLHQIKISYELLAGSGMDMGFIEREIATALRDSIVVTLTVPGHQQAPPSVETPLQSLDLTIAGAQSEVMEFDLPLVRSHGDRAIVKGIESSVLSVVDHGTSAELRSQLARSLRQTDGAARLASFWLLIVASERELDRQRHGNELFNFTDEISWSDTIELEELYSFALRVLAEQTNEVAESQIQSLALRVLALRARAAGEDFRYELLDALYAVLHTLATPDETLQRASITTLNILTSACGYGSIQDLIVENVDYLTNAVALRLNAFDVSPQAPQVLLMMLRLAGPTLLPHLEDTVESIFAALEDFHGYPLLVELLFRVLGVMAEEGVKAPQLAIEGGEKASQGDTTMDRWTSTTVQGLATQLRLRAQDELESRQADTVAREPHPKRPWATKEHASSLPDDDDDDTTEDNQERSLDNTEPAPPGPRTYNLLLKVTELTQHFLPSASASLRTSLLALIRTTAPALARHENSFLPLINTLWPEIVARLDDEEAHIRATALDIIRVLCEGAGDFMRSRVVQLWQRFLEIHRSVSRDLVQSVSAPSHASKRDQGTTANLVVRDARVQRAIMRMEGSPSTYGDTSARLLWSSLQAAITAIVKHVNMPPEYVDDALAMTASRLNEPNVKDAFEEANSDAVWLARVKAGLVNCPPAPALPSMRRWRFAIVAD